MLRNYFTTALRQLRKHPAFTFINVLGLAVGLAVCLLVALFVQDELRYERAWADAGRIYRLEKTAHPDTDPARWDVTSALHAAALEADLPEVEETARLGQRRRLVARGQDQVPNVLVGFADPEVFDVFSFDVVAGDPATMLTEPDHLVLTVPLAERLFGAEDPLGQTVSLNNDRAYTVVGLVAMPGNTHLAFEALAPFSVLWETDASLRDWGMAAVFTFVLLRDGASAEAVEARLPELVRRHRPYETPELLHLKPIIELRLRPETTGATGTQEVVTLFTVVGLLVLLIACINYTNLATARGAERVREVGMRKVLGAHRRSLVAQFLGESVGMALVAMGLALLLAELSLPFVNGVADKHLALELLRDVPTLLALFGLCLLVGLLGGAYPALYLTRFHPGQVLGGSRGSTGRGSPRLRQALVVAQFAASITLLIGMMTVHAQFEYLTGADLGLRGEQVVRIQRQGASEDAFQALRRRLEQVPGVESVAAGRGRLGQLTLQATMARIGADDEERQLHYLYPADAALLETMQIELIAGRFFEPERGTDEGRALVVNESSVRALGYADPAAILGEHFKIHFVEDGEVVGVVRDFHFNSLQEAILPLVLVHQEADLTQMFARLRPERLPQTMAQVEQAWKQTVPAWPFVYGFVDQEFDALYGEDARRGDLFALFAAVATFVACLGLFGLASFAVRQRTKEIGIRKVFGARAPGLIGMIAGQFLRLVLAAFVVAAPVAYYLMNEWLRGFAYHVAFPWGSLPVAGGAALVLALLAVSGQAIRAATADPVEALRYE